MITILHKYKRTQHCPGCVIIRPFAYTCGSLREGNSRVDLLMLRSETEEDVAIDKVLVKNLESDQAASVGSSACDPLSHHVTLADLISPNGTYGWIDR